MWLIELAHHSIPHELIGHFGGLSYGFTIFIYGFAIFTSCYSWQCSGWLGSWSSLAVDQANNCMSSYLFIIHGASWKVSNVEFFWENFHVL